MSHSLENCSYLNPYLYRSEQVRELERSYIEQSGVVSFALMRRAGQAAFKMLRQQWPEANSIRIYCGPGNNGGDGYIVAVEAKKAGLQVALVSTVDTAQLTGDAAAACRLAKEWGQKIIDLTDTQGKTQNKIQDKNNPAPDLVIDALLGIGLGGDVRGAVADAIDEINQADCPVLAIDIPSGLCSDTGSILGDAVRADATVTFVGVKQGLLSGRGPGCVGDLYFESIGIIVDELPSIPGLTKHLTKADLTKALPPRSRDAHKGDFGHLLMVGGNYGMAGAITLSTEAALRSGCGLLSVATQPEHLLGLQARLPEAMAHGVTDVAQLEAMLEKATCVAIGPGLGATQWSEHMLKRVLNSGVDLVLDADALNLIAGGELELPALNARQNQSIMTPHPGEAARLLSTTVQQIEADRWAAVKAIQQKYSAVVVLKGAGSLICHWDAELEQQRVALCSAGNPGMASGGMGDVLTGVIAGLLAQGLAAHEAARLGVLVHALSADQAALGGERGMVATDLMPFIRQQVNF
ncbi:MAG: NAD(P)H-hydrate dehydratase [Proteobacteria bacterium]|nr:NAD(P)H-hydrate dehydratase [Pseudomonadota bacterium]